MCPKCRSVNIRIRIDYGECLGVERETGYQDCIEEEYGECKDCGHTFSLDEQVEETERTEAA
jgi:hypothetical protein